MIRQLITVILVLTLTILPSYATTPRPKPPKDLYKGLIAEAAEDKYHGMLVVACVVRNRLDQGMDHGLVGMRRPDLDAFVTKEGEKRIAQAQRIVYVVFDLRIEDITNGATHFEDVKYKKPYWAYSMIQIGRYRSHILYKERPRRKRKTT